MRSRFPSIDLKGLPLILDASATINLLGTAIPEQFLRNVGSPVLMTAEAFGEVRRHPIRGQDSQSTMAALTAQGLLRVIELGERGRTIFRELVSGDLTEGLDDGEAASIAATIEHSVSAVVVIDERKARRIVGQQWPGCGCVDTLSVLAQPHLRVGLSDEVFAAAIFTALLHARMWVPQEAREWTIELIGEGRASKCSSLGYR